MKLTMESVVVWTVWCRLIFALDKYEKLVQ